MFIISRMHCVCKQKQIDFFPFGDCITDVLVLCVLYFPQMQHTEELWVCMVTVSGGKDGRRYITVHNLCSSLSNITCQILPSLHALTGCDTTSAFVRIGKKYAYKILKTSTEELSDLVSLNNADRETTIFMQQDMHYLCNTIPRENSSRVIMIFTCCGSN